MASKAAGDAPYGFSLELRRTMPLAADFAGALVAAGAAAAREAGNRKATAAAPVPRIWTKPRLERDFAVMVMACLREEKKSSAIIGPIDRLPSPHLNRPVRPALHHPRVKAQLLSPPPVAAPALFGWSGEAILPEAGS